VEAQLTKVKDLRYGRLFPLKRPYSKGPLTQPPILGHAPSLGLPAPVFFLYLRRVKLLLLTMALILSSCAVNTGKHVPVAKQSRLPDLYERDQYNRLVSLRSYGAQDYLLIFFYPEADTPG